jgi:SAM-dependent methyltransferase
VFPSVPLTATDSAIFETAVVPHYLQRFGNLALSMFLPTEGARVANIGCRTGYPDHEICSRISKASVYGVDCAGSALDLARNKAAAAGFAAQYFPAEDYPTSLPAGAFSHVLSLCPVLGAGGRRSMMAEMARLLYSGGQALLAMPLRGSFQEVGDLIREYALKNDDGDLGRAIDDTMSSRPTLETLSEELEACGLEDVDVRVRQETMPFDNGRALIEDPSIRLLILPDLVQGLSGFDLRRPVEYLREAVDRYWSEACFELSVNVGCASSRKAM